MRYATTIVNDAICDGGLSQQEGDFDEAVEVYGAEIDRDRADAYAFALALAVLTWLADTFEADREIARATFAVFTLSRVWADRPACVLPTGSEIVENVSPVDLTQRAKARADLDAWMQAGIDGGKVAP